MSEYHELIKAIGIRDASRVIELVDNGMNVNARAEIDFESNMIKGMTPLYIAVLDRSPDIVSILIQTLVSGCYSLNLNGLRNAVLRKV